MMMRLIAFILVLVGILPPVWTLPSPSLSAASRLKLGDTLVSPRGHFEFGIFQISGQKYHLCIRYGGPVLDQVVTWVANRDTPVSNTSYLELSSADGNLRLFDSSNGLPLWISANTSNANVQEAQLLDSGNLVLVDSTGTTKWESFRNSSATDTLLPGQYLYRNSSLTSWLNSENPTTRGNGSTYTFGWGARAKPQLAWTPPLAPGVLTNWTDGRYVPAPVHVKYTIYTVDTNYWVYFDTTYGNLYFTSSYGHTFILLGGDVLSNTTLKRLTLDTDGGLRIWQWTVGMSKTWAAVANWVVNDQGSQCFAFGTCGPFGLCHMTPPKPLDRAKCTCLAGISDSRDLSCASFPKGYYCDENHSFKMTELDGVDIRWGVDYRQFTTDGAGCRQECLKDCNCTGAVHSRAEARCRMLTGDLYNVGYPNPNRTAFVKVPFYPPTARRLFRIFLASAVIAGIFTLFVGFYWVMDRSPHIRGKVVAYLKKCDEAEVLSGDESDEHPRRACERERERRTLTQYKAVCGCMLQQHMQRRRCSLPAQPGPAPPRPTTPIPAPPVSQPPHPFAPLSSVPSRPPAWGLFTRSVLTPSLLRSAHPVRGSPPTTRVLPDTDALTGDYVGLLSAALIECDRRRKEFVSLAPSVSIFKLLCNDMVKTLSPVAKINFEQCREILAKPRRDIETPSDVWSSSVRFCSESLAGLAQGFQLVVDLLRKCVSREWWKSALELADVHPPKDMERWSQFSLAIQTCEWSLDLVELAFQALETLLTTGRTSPVTFHWVEARGRMVLESRVYNSVLFKHCRDLEKQDVKALAKKLMKLETSERRKKWFYRSFSTAHEIAGFLGTKLVGPTPKTGEYIPYSWMIDPAHLRLMRQYLDVEMLHGAGNGVHKVWWNTIKVAVKAVHNCDRKVFEREAAILGMVQHPNVVRLIGCGFVENINTGLLVMELMDGDLHELIKSRLKALRSGSCPFPPSVAIDIMLQIAQAMLYLRKHKVLHRDLKAKNILVNVHHEHCIVAKLADFGLAKHQPRTSDVATLNAGTTRWRAPEVFNKHDDALVQHYKWPADVYSYGMTCYEVLTGKIPFQDEHKSNGGLQAKVEQGERPPLENLSMEVPEALKDLIRWCWETDPDARPQSFDVVVKRLWECKVQLSVPSFLQTQA